MAKPIDQVVADYCGVSRSDAKKVLDGVRLLKRAAVLAIKSAAQEVTKKPPKRRLKWHTDRKPDENYATFAWRAYAAEAKAGTLHRALIGREDKELAVKLRNWLRRHKMPVGIDIPSLPEWNTRQLAKLPGRPKVDRTNDPQAALYAAAQRRTRKPGIGG